MIIFKHKYELLDYAEQKGLPSIYDLLEKVQAKKDTDVACTDGTNIYVNPDNFNEMTPEDEFFVLSHELLHILYKHNKMSSERYPNREILNVCQDVVINEYLVKKLKHRPDSALMLDNISQYLKSRGKILWDIEYNGVLTTNSLYYYLANMMDDQMQQDFSNMSDGLAQGDQDSQGQTSSEDTEITSDILKEVRTTLKIDNDMLKRETQTRMTKEELEETEPETEEKVAGEGQGHYKDLSGNVRTVAKQDIIKFVQEFIGNHAVVKGRSQTYSRPNRRFHSNELLLKGYKHTKTIKEIAIYLDTSGSMNSNFVSDMFTTLKTIYQTTHFKFYQFDNYVQTVDLKNATGLYTGGGTYINGVLRHIEDNKHDVSIMITDCEDNFSLKNVKSELMIFTNNYKFKSDNGAVRVTYWQ